ncbi:hypothetical protein KR51_00022070 [Rubidibacter lacunae KORDI 51-2]|uniref:Uncharacterized protein n=1 Tax=Rubidibacter lacunae KORDI 51-2 TaxID=582515 RepID=U5DHU9_9CHRO|nr:hypothetical protein [Rubidibacter lacunae]ERN41231.1 hypothetical protein KR51_00022070 [Rubidibacter lacunae KORDI 51-2]
MPKARKTRDFEPSPDINESFMTEVIPFGSWHVSHRSNQTTSRTYLKEPSIYDVCQRLWLASDDDFGGFEIPSYNMLRMQSILLRCLKFLLAKLIDCSPNPENLDRFDKDCSPALQHGHFERRQATTWQFFEVPPLNI